MRKQHRSIRVGMRAARPFAAVIAAAVVAAAIPLGAAVGAPAAGVVPAEIGAPPAQVDPARPVIGSRVVLATVTDLGNRPLTDLGPDDFAVEENGQPREALSLHLADYPVALLLDDATAADEDAIRSAAVRFVSKLGERPIAVGTLTDPAHALVSFDAPRSSVLEAIHRFHAVNAPSLPLEAAATAADAVVRSGSPFAAIVVISGSAVTPSPDDRRFLTPVLASHAPVYVVANRGGEGPASADDVLRAMAEDTHGLYTAIYSSASYAIALDRLADRLATEMMIEYVVPGGGPLTGDVRVGVKIPGAKATGLGVSK